LWWEGAPRAGEQKKRSGITRSKGNGGGPGHFYATSELSLEKGRRTRKSMPSTGKNVGKMKKKGENPRARTRHVLGGGKGTKKSKKLY